MPKIIVINRAGEEQIIDGKIGLSLMELIRDGGIDELPALCGGNCACATCHVHVDPSFAIGLPTMSDVENDLLDSCDHRNQYSRLSCQIQMSEHLNGLKIRIAESD